MMNPTIDEMLTLTAEIAEGLLNVKDAGAATIPDTLKLNIATLAELASSLPEEKVLTSPQEAAEEPSAEAAFEVEQEMSEAIEEEQAAELTEDIENVDDAELADDQEAVLEEIPEVAEPAPVEAEVERPRLEPMDIMRAFSINDKFFFRREIFGGSKEKMDEALVTIAYLRDLRELQAYLVEVLNLNLNETPGREFYDKLKYFF